MNLHVVRRRQAPHWAWRHETEPWASRRLLLSSPTPLVPGVAVPEEVLQILVPEAAQVQEQLRPEALGDELRARDVLLSAGRLLRPGRRRTRWGLWNAGLNQGYYRSPVLWAVQRLLRGMQAVKELPPPPQAAFSELFPDGPVCFPLSPPFPFALPPNSASSPPPPIFGEQGPDEDPRRRRLQSKNRHRKQTPTSVG